MKITLPAQSLRKILSDALMLGTGDATHPGFTIAHCEVTKKGGFRITVVNSRAALRMVHVGDVTEFEPGAAAFSLMSLESMTRVLPGDDRQTTVSLVDAGPDRASMARIKCGDTLMKFAVHSLENVIPFPTMPDDLEWRAASEEALTRITRHCLWCAASVAESRVNLQGLHMTPDTVEATDGKKLVLLKEPGLVGEPVIMPAAMVGTAVSLAGDAGVRIATGKGRAWVTGRNFALTCRLIDGPYAPTSTVYMTPTPDGTVNLAMGRAKCNEIEISLPGLWSAAATMSKVYGGKTTPVMQFMVRGNEMNVFMKNGQETGIDIAQKLEWRPGAMTPDAAGISELNKLLLDAQFVNQVAGSLPKSDYVTMLWTSSRDRIQLMSGDVKAVIMPKDRI